MRVLRLQPSSPTPSHLARRSTFQHLTPHALSGLPSWSTGEVDFELSSKTAGHTAQDPALKSSDSAGTAAAADCLVVATAVTAEVTADLVPMDELIQVTARAAGIPEDGLRQYIEDTKCVCVRAVSTSLMLRAAALCHAVGLGYVTVAAL